MKSVILMRNVFFLKRNTSKFSEFYFLEFEKCKIYLNAITLYKLIRNRGLYILIYYCPQEVGKYFTHTNESAPPPLSDTEQRQIKNLEHSSMASATDQK